LFHLNWLSPAPTSAGMNTPRTLALLFLISLGVSVMVFLRAVPQLDIAGSEPAAPDEILVATVSLVAGALLRV
jgi:hypothetical protein